MFIPSHIQQNRKVAAVLYRKQKNMKIIWIELNEQQKQQQQQHVNWHNSEVVPQKTAQHRIQLL